MLERCHYEGAGSRIHHGNDVGMPSRITLTLQLELGHDGIMGTGQLGTATVQHDGALELSLDVHRRTATDCHVVDPANTVLHRRITQTNPLATLTR